MNWKFVCLVSVITVLISSAASAESKINNEDESARKPRVFERLKIEDAFFMISKDKRSAISIALVLNSDGTSAYAGTVLQKMWKSGYHHHWSFGKSGMISVDPDGEVTINDLMVFNILQRSKLTLEFAWPNMDAGEIYLSPKMLHLSKVLYELTHPKKGGVK